MWLAFNDPIDSERLFYIASIILLAIASYCGLVALLAIRAVYITSCSAQLYTPDDLILIERSSLPKYVKVQGTISQTSPLLTSPITRHSNCLLYRFKVKYHYNEKVGSWSVSDGAYKYQVYDRSITIIDQPRTLVPEFDLICKNGGKVTVKTAPAITVNYNGSACYEDQRGRRNSSNTYISCPGNPNFHKVGVLPLPHSRSYFEIEEEWGEYHSLRVYGVASKNDEENGEHHGSVTIAAGGFNNRMVIAKGGEAYERMGICVLVTFSILCIISLLAGIFFFYNPDAVELPWFPNNSTNSTQN